MRSTRQPVRAVAFDFDGTLADSFGAFLTAYGELAASRGLRPILPHRIEALRAMEARQILAELAIPLHRVPELAHALRQTLATRTDRIPCFPGVAQVLPQLAAAGYPLAVVSSNREATVRAVLGLDLAPLIGHYRCGASLFGKAARLKGLCRRLGLAPREVVYVGDEFRDYRAAQEAGLAFVGVAWGYNRLDATDLSQQFPILSHLDELPGHLAGHPLYDGGPGKV